MVSVKVEVPIKSFSSGEPDRDLAVFDLLGGKEQPNIVVETDLVDASKLKELFDGRRSSIGGIIQIANRSFPVTIELKNGPIGKISTTFSQLDLTPPSQLWGVFFRVDDKLELSFVFNEKLIENL